MDTNKAEKQIKEFLQEKLDQSGAEGFVVGISGGVDSALTSALCADVGPTHVVDMPILKENKNAEKHFDWLDEEYDFGWLKYTKVDLTSTYEEMIGANRTMDARNPNQNLLGETDDETANLVKANLQSRLRMSQLYFIANLENKLVVGTGNKVEDFGVGFFTKYGDGGVDIAPIADLLKSEVVELASHLGVMEEITQAKPTDGLWEDQRTDEDQLGLSYDEIEDIMKNGESANVSKQKYDRYLELHRKSRHKLETPPVPEIEKQ